MSEPEDILQLFDSFWFHHKIFSLKPFPSIPKPIPVAQSNLIPKTNEKQTPQLTRSLSSGHSKDMFSLHQDHHTEETATKIPIKKKPESRRKHDRNRGKSLSELEFEELKGFKDMGFVFSEEDISSSLVSVIPGLQKQGMREIENGVSRPYLSESWEFLEKIKNYNDYYDSKSLLVNWKIPNIGTEIDMKDHLRVWAHTVASAVR